MAKPIDFNVPVFSEPLEVRVRPGRNKEEQDKNLDRALSQFKKVLEKDGLVQQMKDREYYISPGRKRYVKWRQARYKRLLKAKKAQFFQKYKSDRGNDTK